MDFWEGLGVAVVSGLACGAVGNGLGKASRQQEIDDAYYQGCIDQQNVDEQQIRLLLYQKQELENRVRQLEEDNRYLQGRVDSLEMKRQQEPELVKKAIAEFRAMIALPYAPDWTDPPTDKNHNGQHPDP